MKYGHGVGYSANFKLPEYRIGPGMLGKIPPNLPIASSVLVWIILVLLGLFRVLSWGNIFIFGGAVGIVASVLSILSTYARKRSAPKPDREGILKKKVIVKSKAKGIMKYRLVFEFSNGAEYNLELNVDEEPIFQYYEPGDKVCFHDGYTYPEKYEKLFDDRVVCISCGRLYPTEISHCRQCQLTLLK